MVSIGVNNFGILDYITVGFTLLVSLAIGCYHAFKGKGKASSEDMLMGGRKMKVVPIAISMLVTYLSAIAILGYPSEVYQNGIQIFWIHVILTFFCIPAAVYLFMTVLYNLKLTSVYEYFQLRFDSVAVRLFASFIFLLQMTVITSVALYAPAIALEAFLGLPVEISVVGIGIIGTVYTSIGGFKAVVWTDVFQFVLIMLGMITIVIKGFISSGGIYEAFRIADANHRLELFNWNIDPFERYNTLNFLVGYGVAIACFYGAHQPNVQRYSSLPTLKDAIKAMIWNAMFKEITNILVILTGISIFATYAGCDPILLGEIKKADQIVPYFFIKELAYIPGMLGIFTSCIFSAVLSTISSALNSLAAVTWEDFFLRIEYFQNLKDSSKGRVTILLSALYGCIIIGLAFVVSTLGSSIFQVTITVIGAFSGTLGGTFLMGIFLPCINKVGALAGMSLGLFCTGLLTIQAFILKTPYSSLPTNIDSCPVDTDFSRALNSTAPWVATEYEWPTKIFTISYILYPFIGSAITIIVGTIVSLIASPFLKTRRIESKYLHPLSRWLCCISSEDDEDDKPERFPQDIKVLASHESNNNFKNGSRNGKLYGVENGAFEMKNL